MTRDDALKVVSVLFGAWARKPDRGMATAYVECITDLDYHACMRALRRLICEGTEHPPPVGKLRQAVLRDCAPELFVPAEAAWSEVLRAVSRWGLRGKPTWSSAVVEQAVGEIGWNTICNSVCIGVERAHFVRAYDDIATRARSVAAMEMQPRLTSAELQLCG